MLPVNSSLKIQDQHTQSIALIDYSSSSRLVFKTEITRLPVTFSLCQFNIPAFEIFVSTISKGRTKTKTTTIQQQKQQQQQSEKKKKMTYSKLLVIRT
jgi:hypothetical protein